MLIPVATPMSKLMPNNILQNLVMARQIGRPVMTWTVSMIARSSKRPSVSGTNGTW